jgi:serine/threonine-protein kinase
MVVASALTPDRIRAEVKRIQASPVLASAPSLRQLLEVTVEKTLLGQEGEIKETTLAIEVFGRKTSFDPQADPIVRVQARKLRDRIAAWYETGGAQDDVIIEYVRGSYVPRFALRRASDARQRAVAVLPFADLSGTPGLEYLCDGVAEEIRYLLGRVHRVKVVAHSSSQGLRHTNGDTREIGALLHADLLIRGTVRSSGSTLRITAQLIAVEDGLQVWAERWEFPDSDLFKVQDEIAAAAASALRSHVAPQQSAHSSTTNLEAHHLFSKGRFYWNQRTEHGFRRAIDHYEGALALDPGFARAYASLAETYTLLAAHHLDTPADCFAKARECAMRAIELDPNLAAAHSARAATLLLLDRKPAEAKHAWKAALELDPTYAYAWHGLAVFGCFVWPDWPEALTSIKQAHRLEPLSAAIACDIGFVLYATGRYEEGIEQCRAALDMHPTFARTYVCLARCQAALGVYDGAVETCNRGRPLFTGRAFLGQLLATQAFAYGCMGMPEQATDVLRSLQATFAGHFLACMDMALVHTGLGNTDAALDLLQRANEDHEFWAISIPTDPLLRRLHDHPRFRDIASSVFVEPTGR